MSEGTITNCGLEFNFPLNTMDYSPAPSIEDLRDEISECNLKYTLIQYKGSDQVWVDNT